MQKKINDYKPKNLLFKKLLICKCIPINQIRVPQWLSSKHSACNVEAPGDKGSIPGMGSSLGERHGNPFQYSCLENPMDGGAWWAAVYGKTKSRTRLKQLNNNWSQTYTRSVAQLDMHPTGMSVHLSAQRHAQDCSWKLIPNRTKLKATHMSIHCEMGK